LLVNHIVSRSAAAAERLCPTPYDGIDQDCDGADLTDVDGDGFDSTAVKGGEDCDDENPEVYPGAPEVCNGVDDDCDGDKDGSDSDVVDASTWYIDSDHDGYGDASETRVACEESYGYADNADDCDDGDPAINPGATEVVNDVDDNCNGWTDERTVCPDGSSEFLTIQEAADAAQDGSTILLCEGEHEGGTELKGRQLSIRGNTTDPSAVVVGTGSGRALDIIGGDVELSWLSLTTETASKVLLASDGRLSIDTVRFVTSDANQTVEATSMYDVDISHSYFESGGYVSCEGIGTLTMTHNVFEGVGVGSFSEGNFQIHHNLIVGSSWLALFGSQSDTSCSFYNNTVANLTDWSLYVTWDYDTVLPQVQVYDNIFAFIDSGWLYYVYWYTYHGCETCYDIAEVAPQRFSDNVIFEVPDPLAFLKYLYHESGYYGGSVGDDGLSGYIEYDNVFENPDFETDKGGQGSYALSSTSIAAGKGAFGGARGDWWKDVPWDMP